MKSINEIKKETIKQVWRLKVYDFCDNRVEHDYTYPTKQEARQAMSEEGYTHDTHGGYEITIEEECVIDEISLNKSIRIALKEGVIEGLTRYAWWKNGVQYVGSCGTTLKKALDDVDKEFEMQCKKSKGSD